MSASDGRQGEGERIARRIARAGVASRRAAEAMIAEGRIAVNGSVIDSPALNVTARDRITVDGQPLAAPEPARLWRYYKPVGLVTSERDEKGRETVFSQLPPAMPRVLSVGRLDLNSEGLLLLTNDGALKRRLELPTTGWLRKYRVRARGEADDAMLEPLRRGIVVDGERFQPMTVSLDRTQGANVWLTVSLREGRNREVRRALEVVGLAVNRLIRVSYGPFQLGELAPGEVEEVRPKVLREQLGVAAQSPQPPERRPPGGAADRGAGGKAGGSKAGDGSKAGGTGRSGGGRAGDGSKGATGTGGPARGGRAVGGGRAADSGSATGGGSVGETRTGTGGTSGSATGGKTGSGGKSGSATGGKTGGGGKGAGGKGGGGRSGAGDATAGAPAGAAEPRGAPVGAAGPRGAGRDYSPKPQAAGRPGGPVAGPKSRPPRGGSEKSLTPRPRRPK